MKRLRLSCSSPFHAINVNVDRRQKSIYMRVGST